MYTFKYKNETWLGHWKGNVVSHFVILAFIFFHFLNVLNTISLLRNLVNDFYSTATYTVCCCYYFDDILDFPTVAFLSSEITSHILFSTCYHFQWQEHVPHHSSLVKMDAAFQTRGFVMVTMTVGTILMSGTVHVSSRAAYKWHDVS